MGEYLFQRNAANSVEETLTNIPADIAVLPDIAGTGNVFSLHKAMMDDSSGGLKLLVKSFVAENDYAVRSDLMQQILYKWTGSEIIETGSRGGNINAQKLVVLEKFLGTSFVGADTTANPNNPNSH